MRSVSAILLLILVASVYLGGSKYFASRKAQKLLSTISQAGLPTTRLEARQYFESLHTAPDLRED